MGKYNHSYINAIYSDWHYSMLPKCCHCSDLDVLLTNSKRRIMMERPWLEIRFGCFKCLLDVKSSMEYAFHSDKPLSYQMMAFTDAFPIPFFTVIMEIPQYALEIYKKEFPKRQDWKLDSRFQQGRPSFTVIDKLGIPKQMSEEDYIAFIQ